MKKIFLILLVSFIMISCKKQPIYDTRPRDAFEISNDSLMTPQDVK